MWHRTGDTAPGVGRPSRNMEVLVVSDEWGPGQPASPAGGGSRAESGESEIEKDEDPETSVEEEVDESAQESRETDPEATRDPLDAVRSGWRDGSVEDVIRKGDYAFLPVFGFNEGHVAVRRHAERREITEDEWWDEEGNKVGRMFGDDVAEEEPTKIDGKELSWWEEDSIMPQHPFMLINPVGFTTADADQRDFRDLFRVGKGDQFVFSDSGGYQIMSMDDAEIIDSREDHSFQDLKVYPERLLEWQVHNADAGASIDFPPYYISGDANFPDAVEHDERWREFYVERRKKSAKMAGRMGDRLTELREEADKEALDYIYSPVLHGKPHPGDPQKYIRQWHQAVSEEIEFVPRGWVLKPEPSHNYGQIALHLGYAAEELVDPAEYIHVLMVGGLLQKTLLMYFASKTDVMVTSDASSYAAGGKRRQFDLPKTARRRSVIITNRSEEEREDSTMDATRLDRYPCRCQVCATVERTQGFEFVTGGTGSARNATLNLHNLHQALSIERTLDALLREDDTEIVETEGDPTGSEFWRFVKTIGSDKKIKDLYLAIDYIRIAIEEGLKAANRQYRILWKQNTGRSILPASGSAADDGWAKL